MTTNKQYYKRKNPELGKMPEKGTKERSEFMKKIRSMKKVPQCPDGSFKGWDSQSLRNLAAEFGVKKRNIIKKSEGKRNLCALLKKYSKGNKYVKQKTGIDDKWNFEDYKNEYNQESRQGKSASARFTKVARDNKRFGYKPEIIGYEDDTNEWIINNPKIYEFLQTKRKEKTKEWIKQNNAKLKAVRQARGRKTRKDKGTRKKKYSINRNIIRSIKPTDQKPVKTLEAVIKKGFFNIFD